MLRFQGDQRRLIEQLAKYHHLTEIAEILGMSKQQFHRYKTGERELPEEHFDRLLKLNSEQHPLVFVILEDDCEIDRSFPLDGYTEKMALDIRNLINPILPDNLKIEVETGDDTATWFLD